MPDASAALRSCGPHRARASSPTPTTSRWPAAARWRAWPTPGCARRHVCASHGEARIDQRSGARAATAISAASASANCSDAAAVLGVAEVIVLDHPDGDLRWDDVPELHAEIVALIRRYRAGRGHHLRRGRPLLAPRSHRRPRADATPRCCRSAPTRRRSTTSRCRRGIMREVVEAAHAKGWAPPPTRASGASRPTPSASAPSRRRFVVDVARLGAAQARRAALPPHADGPEQSVRAGSTTTKRGAGSASSIPPRAARRHRRPDARASRRNHPCRSSTLDVLRCPYCGGRLELVDVAVPPPHRRRDPRRHPRLPLLHLSGRRRHPGAAPAAGRDDRARAHRGRPARPGAPRDVRPRRRRAGRARSTRSASSDTATYRDIVEALGPNFEGGYFLYRFSDPTYIVAAGGGAGGRRGTVLRRHAARDRHLRRIGPSDAHRCSICRRRRRCSPICTSRRSGWRGASPRRAASRSAATATRRCRSRAARSATRCARTRSCTSGPSGSSSARWRGWSTAARRAGRGADRPHPQRADLEPVARPAAVAGRLRAICSRRSSRASSAKAACSPTSSPAGRWISPGATTRRRSTPSRR